MPRHKKKTVRELSDSDGDSDHQTNSSKQIVGRLEPLHQDGNVTAWIEQFQIYCSLNNIGSKQKVLLFLSSLSQEVYNLLRDLTLPETPSSKSYESLKNILIQHFQPPPNFFVERFNFRERRQIKNESISEYVRILRKMSEHCKFEGTLNDALRDQLVWGVLDVNIKRKLLSTGGNMTFQECVELACSMEAASQSAAKLAEHNVSHSASTSTELFSVSNNQRQPRVKCWCCGDVGHVKPSCKFLKSTCSVCKKKGHLSKVCRSKSHDAKQVNQMTEEMEDLHLDSMFTLEPEIDMYNIKPNANETTVKFIKPLVIKLRVNKLPIDFQIDTGSAITAMGWDLAKNLLKVKEADLAPCNIRLRVYNNEIITPMGCISVEVNESLNLTLYIFVNAGPPIVGRDWLESLGILNNIINHVELDVEPIKLFEKYKSVFSDTIGTYHREVSLKMKPESRPIFFKPRPLPFSMKEKVSTEIDKLVKEGVLVEVESSDWATPIVAIPKTNGRVRICGDYKVTLNQNLIVDKHPVPRINDLISSISGSTFAKLDMAEAYLQIPLCKESQLLTTISTFRGLYSYTKLPYGISSAPGLFIREIERLFVGMPGVIVYFDDIFISATDNKELTQRIEKVLEKLASVGLTLNKDKCLLYQDSIDFLGYTISKNGVSIPKHRISAIRDMKCPKNLSELRAYLGMVTFYSKFIKNMSKLASPLYHLLKKNTPFKWTKIQNKAFSDIKEAIINSCTLSHYDPDCQLVVNTDASAMGIAGVLSQVKDHKIVPLAFCSKTLNKAEAKYSVLHKEALAIVFTIKYFHQYLYGQNFILNCDHKPLISIFGEKKAIPIMSAQRLQRYAVFLQGYNYVIKYIKGNQNVNADALSRLPVESDSNVQVLDDDYIGEENFHLNFVLEEIDSISDLEIVTETQKDNVLRNVYQFILSNKWPEKEVISCELKPYYDRRNELSVANGFILWGHKLIIPTNCRTYLLRELHSTHMGIVKTKSIARGFLWWPGLDSDIEGMTKTCESCIEHGGNPSQSPLNCWPAPKGPGKRVHIDFFGPWNNMMFVVILDAYSKWLFVKKMNDITSSTTIQILREYFSNWGIPEKLVSDNGSSFCSEEMESFLLKNGIVHIKTAPYHPSSNGAAENVVKTTKNFLKRSETNIVKM